MLNGYYLSLILHGVFKHVTTTATVLKICSILISLLRYYHTTATVLKISFILISLLRYYHTTATVLKICSILISIPTAILPYYGYCFKDLFNFNIPTAILPYYGYCFKDFYITCSCKISTTYVCIHIKITFTCCTDNKCRYQFI